MTDEHTNRRITDSPRWCDECEAYGDHHTDRHPSPQDYVPVVFLCEVTSEPMTDGGFCPVHRGDACIAAYRHHRETGDAS